MFYSNPPITGGQDTLKIEMQKYRSDGRMIVDPLRLKWLRIKQQSFRQSIEQFKWNYLLEEDDHSKNDKDKDNNNEDDEDDNNSNADDNINASSPTTGNKTCKYSLMMVTAGDDNMAKSDMANYIHVYHKHLEEKMALIIQNLLFKNKCVVYWEN